MYSRTTIAVLDRLLAGLLIVILGPVFIFFGLVLAFSGERKVLYFQERIGIDGKTFKVIKFATMLEKSSKIGSKGFVDKNDARLLPFGSFLRRTKINELPQLINVCLGEMSLVGTRPMVPSTFNVAARISDYQFWTQRPGLTGLASVCFRNEEDLLRGVVEKEAYYMQQILPQKLELDRLWHEAPTVRNYFIVLILTGIALFNPIAPEKISAMFSK